MTESLLKTILSNFEAAASEGLLFYDEELEKFLDFWLEKFPEAKGDLSLWWIEDIKRRLKS